MEDVLIDQGVFAKIIIQIADATKRIRQTAYPVDYIDNQLMVRSMQFELGHV